MNACCGQKTLLTKNWVRRVFAVVEKTFFVVWEFTIEIGHAFDPIRKDWQARYEENRYLCNEQNIKNGRYGQIEMIVLPEEKQRQIFQRRSFP